MTRSESTSSKGLAGVAGTERIHGGRCPGEVLVGKSRTAELQRITDRCAGRFRDSDVGARQPGSRAVDRAEDTFVGQELDNGATVVDQGDTVWRSILEAVRGVGHIDDAKAAADVGNGAGEGRGVIRSPVTPVVEHDAPAGEVGAGRPCDLDRLADIGARVVVVDLIDENCRLGRHRDGCGENS